MDTKEETCKYCGEMKQPNHDMVCEYSHGENMSKYYKGKQESK